MDALCGPIDEWELEGEDGDADGHAPHESVGGCVSEEEKETVLKVCHVGMWEAPSLILVDARRGGR